MEEIAAGEKPRKSAAARGGGGPAGAARPQAGAAGEGDGRERRRVPRSRSPLHRAALPGHAGRGAARGRRVGARDQVRRLPHRRARGRRRRAPVLAQRARLDRPVQGGRRRSGDPADRRHLARRRGGGVRRARRERLRPPAAVRQGAAAGRPDLRGVRPAVPGRRGPARAAAPRAQAPAALAARARRRRAARCGPLRRPHRGPRRRRPRRGLPAGTRGHRLQARRRHVRRPAHEVLAQEQVRPPPGVRRRRLHRADRLAHGVRRPPPRACTTRRAPCALPVASAAGSTTARSPGCTRS